MKLPARRAVLAGLGLAAAAALLVWRILAPAWHLLYLDLLLLHGVYTAVAPDRREWPLVTTAVSLLLMAIFLKGQVPHALWVLDLLP